MPIRKEEATLSLFVDDIILHIRNSKKFYKFQQHGRYKNVLVKINSFSMTICMQRKRS